MDTLVCTAVRAQSKHPASTWHVLLDIRRLLRSFRVKIMEVQGILFDAHKRQIEAFQRKFCTLSPTGGTVLSIQCEMGTLTFSVKKQSPNYVSFLACSWNWKSLEFTWVIFKRQKLDIKCWILKSQWQPLTNVWRRLIINFQALDRSFEIKGR